MEELMPFATDKLHDLVPIVDDDDLKQFGLFSDIPLTKRYRDAKEHVKKAHAPKSNASPKEMSPKLEEYIRRSEEELLGLDTPLLGQQTASNNFVVHGNHTTTGMPLFASDPHLANVIPNHWILYNLEFDDGRIISGAQLAGLPAVAIGRSNNIAWACTTARTDTADVWQEKLNEDETEYFVDNEWRKLKIIEETIKIKG